MRAALVLWIAGVLLLAIVGVFAWSCWRIGERVCANVRCQSFEDCCREFERLK